MSSETDAEFVADMEWLYSHDREAALPFDKLVRLFALARRGAAVQWRPIEEAPKDGTHILVTNGKKQAATYWWPAGWMGTTHWGMNDPTHFMPLPLPPSGEPRDE